MFKSINEAIRFRMFLAQHGLNETIQEKRGHYIYVFQHLITKKDRYVEALIRYIQEKIRTEWVDQVLLTKYRYENEDERHKIIEIVNDMFNGERNELTCLLKNKNEDKILHEAILDLLNFQGSVRFDAFLKFRLKAYFEVVEQYLGIALDEYKMEQDYQIFIQMLRDYLQQRPTQINMIHLLLDYPVTFYDEKLHELTRNEIEQYLDPRLLSNHPVYVDSAVIAPLLSIAPKKIFLYTENEDQPLIRTLINIFEERLVIFPPNYLQTLLNSYSEHS